MKDQIKRIIISKYDELINNNQVVDRSFFDSEILKEDCKKALEIIFPILYAGQKYNLTEKEFNTKYDIALKEAKYDKKTSMSPSISLQKNYNNTWLTVERINRLKWNDDDAKSYRTRYLKYLEKIGRTNLIIKETERSSLEIIKKIGDPESDESFFIKGLVVGSVQSGKTSNFNAVINSSIDVGYKLIIVLSGLMEDLRSQTQKRIEKEVEGRMVRTNEFIGVGEISSFGQLGKHPDVNQIIVPTSETNDFNRTMQEAQFSLNNTNILICKKNTSVLQNLLLWLNVYLNENKEKNHIPFLIIDDEADNASINNLGNKGKEYSNKINGHIRALLALFNKKTYIGYTATPFANVLQDLNEKPTNKWIVKDTRNNLEVQFDQEGNLFPEDFIELLYPPSNYLGPKNFFETRIEDVKKIEPLIADSISDHLESFPERVFDENEKVFVVDKVNDKYEFDINENLKLKFEDYKSYKRLTRAPNKFDNFPQFLPESLKHAIKCFIISISIRSSRRQEMAGSILFQRHNTMLIHISRFTEWQNRTKRLVEIYIDSIRDRLVNDNINDPNSIYSELQKVWMKEFVYIMDNISEYLPYSDEFLTKKSFNDIREYLINSTSGIEIKAVNTQEKDILNYDGADKKYIVIGGNKLSRGFTLEGLSINYFVRNTNYADALLQMGRWFGYRPGYIDCCKLFSTYETLNKFDLCTWTIEELEEEFKKLVDSSPQKKPIDYATKILNHPGVLKLTRPSVLKNSSTIKGSFEDRVEQSTEFYLTKSTIENSWSNFKNLYQKNANKFSFDEESGFIKLFTNKDGLFEFLNSQETFTSNFENIALQRFLDLCESYKKVTNWTIAIRTKGVQNGNSLKKEISGFAEDVILTKRASREKKYIDILVQKKLFKASGDSSNIITSPKDLSLTLDKETIEKAETKFKLKNPTKNYPNHIYVSSMKDTDGLLVVYLMDLKHIYSTDELKNIAISENINLDIPLIGYAVAIPPLNENFGGDYLVNAEIQKRLKLQEAQIDDESDEEEDLVDELNGIINE
jgi:vacuolar-type H+-ATPase subunit F/Vma7